MRCCPVCLLDTLRARILRKLTPLERVRSSRSGLLQQLTCKTAPLTCRSALLPSCCPIQGQSLNSVTSSTLPLGPALAPAGASASLPPCQESMSQPSDLPVSEFFSVPQKFTCWPSPWLSHMLPRAGGPEEDLAAVLRKSWSEGMGTKSPKTVPRLWNR